MSWLFDNEYMPDYFRGHPGFSIPQEYTLLSVQRLIMRCDDRKLSAQVTTGALETFGITLDNRVFPIEAKFWRGLPDQYFFQVMATGELQAWKGVPYPAPALILIGTKPVVPKGFKVLLDVRDEHRRERGRVDGDEKLRTQLAKQALRARLLKWDFDSGEHVLGDEIPADFWKTDSALDAIAQGYISESMDAPSLMYPCDEIVVRIPTESERNGRPSEHKWHRIFGIALQYERKHRTVKLDELVAGVRQELLRQGIEPPHWDHLRKRLRAYW